MKFELMHPREQIAAILARIYTGGMTTTSGGNLSIRDEAGHIWITPKGVDKGELGPADVVCVRADGSIQGIHPPSSEYPFHLAIYQQRPDLQAIIHGHPAALVAFSIVRQVPKMEIVPQARQVCGEIGYAPYAVPGTEALGNSIASTFAQGVNGVIMENHGTVVGGDNLLDAFQRFESMEFCARTLINASRLGSPRYLDEQQFVNADHQEHLLPLLEQIEHPASERELRQSICSFVQRACRQGLMISTYGTVSARWQDDDFIITPTGMDRTHIQAADLVQIRNNRREPGHLPSRSVQVHAEIYRNHPSINSVIVTQPPNIMAFVVSGTNFETRTIPESYLLLKDVPVIPYGEHFSGHTTISDTLSTTTPIVLIENDSILVTGKSVLEAFDRLEVAEFSARSIIDAKGLGQMVPMDTEAIEDLKKHFPHL